MLDLTAVLASSAESGRALVAWLCIGRELRHRCRSAWPAEWVGRRLTLVTAKPVFVGRVFRCDAATMIVGGLTIQ